MATLSAQIQALTGTNVDETQLNQFCEDGVRELTNMFSQELKNMCYTKNTYSSSVAAGSEAETIASKHIGSVYAGNVQCREIDPKDKFKASDGNSIHAASATDPVYYVEGSKLNVLPVSSSVVYYLIPDPSIDADSGDGHIANFPNEAEYLVVLYAAIKNLEHLSIEEEDPELYLPLIQNLKQDYNQGLQMLGIVKQQGAK